MTPRTEEDPVRLPGRGSNSFTGLPVSSLGALLPLRLCHPSPIRELACCQKGVDAYLHSESNSDSCVLSTTIQSRMAVAVTWCVRNASVATAGCAQAVAEVAGTAGTWYGA